MRRIILHSLILITISFVASAQPYQRPEASGTRREKVLILFEENARHIDLVLTTRERIERTGGRVRAVIGLSGILADITPGSGADIAAEEGVQVYSGTIGMPRFADAETASAVAAWNRIRLPEVAARSSNGPPPRELTNCARATPDGPRDRFRAQTLESGYRRHAQELQRSLPPQLQRSLGIGCGTNGADYSDTSLFFAGEISVGVFYANIGSPWTPALTASTFADIVNALDRFIDIQPNARLVFTYVNEVDGAGNPLPSPSNERTYVNDLRSTYCTDWGFLISMSNGGLWPNADPYGPSLRMERTFGWFDEVLRHEVGHIFGAGDAYDPNSPAPRYGYLLAAHANSCGQGGGFFAGAGECVDDLMAGWGPNFGYNSIISPSTAGQLGWLASAGDGVLDVTKTKPVIDAASVVHVVNTTTSAATYHGIAVDRPLLNEQSSYGSVSINRITAVQYRIGSAPWQDATAADGVFDSSSEDFHYTTPPLPNGTYPVQIRAMNTIEAVTPIPYSEQLFIAGSGIANTRPFAELTIAPQRAMVGTTIKASGTTSRDLEPGPLQYSFNWGSAWTPFSPTPIATHVYATPGAYIVQLRVRDQVGLIHLVSRPVTVAVSDTPPVVKLDVTLENQHFASGPNYSVFLSTGASRDAETPFGQLKVRWDVDCNGWDGPAGLQKTKLEHLVNAHYPRSDRRCVRVQVSDIANNTSEVEQYVWVVPYNHRPVISGVIFTPNGSDYILTVNASDPDELTTWDGILEYRYDLEGDGIWDTTYQAGPSIQVPAAYRYSVKVEVRDRFHGRAVWIWNPCQDFPYFTC